MLVDLYVLYLDFELYFIIGVDVLVFIMFWQGWEELFELVWFVGVSWFGYELCNEYIISLLGQLVKDVLILVEILVLVILLIDCCQCVEQFWLLWYLMFDGVVQYVFKCWFYCGVCDVGVCLMISLVVGNGL